ncbi:MAG: peptidyl-prolyl cis-trans isomerase [Bacteroidales bacterium]|nr:peptidyl-prolyl cis-trans isomerase [Bacteroidales bacterium]
MKKWLLIALIAIAGVSCKMVRELSDTADVLAHGELVARVGKHRLHRSELEKFIPSGVTPEDSAGLAKRYINAWAEELIMLEMARKQLSAQEKDLSDELEQYSRSLLKYRYEQKYINQRLDTLVTDDETEAYYKANPDKFKLDRPVMKSRYLIIPADSRSLKTLRKKIVDEEYAAGLLEADSLSLTAAIKYVDASDTWMDVITLAQELGVDYRSLLGSIKNNFAEVQDDNGILHLAYIVEMVPAGKTAPLEYCSTRIKDIILSSRKHALETSLETELLEDALRNNNFVIY